MHTDDPLIGDPAPSAACAFGSTIHRLLVDAISAQSFLHGFPILRLA
jgi:hypothetical protein